jgi:hypothetical protein
MELDKIFRVDYWHVYAPTGKKNFKKIVPMGYCSEISFISENGVTLFDVFCVRSDFSRSIEDRDLLFFLKLAQ